MPLKKLPTEFTALVITLCTLDQMLVEELATGCVVPATRESEALPPRLMLLCPPPVSENETELLVEAEPPDGEADLVELPAVTALPTMPATGARLASD